MFPAVLAPLDDDRRSLESVLHLLEETSEPEVRADLAGELIHFCARYEDALERGLYSTLRNRPGHSAQVTETERRQRRLRDAMQDVRKRTLHVKPINAHADDPEGFERSLEALIAAARAQLDYEDQELLPLVDELGADDRDHLLRNLEHAVAHASSHPDPPHNPVGRAAVNLKEKLDRAVDDTSTISHPGTERLHPEGGRGVGDN
ncbi:MAG TPA: hemerythrin domain-containing protein [Acidimicrobiales bacterium]|jgi:hypothetical protein|nr:hemerythrin domain-containing protein [Acidimicrobiales bacterium]